MIGYQGHRDQKFGHLTYSQHGEDLLLVNLFKLMGIDKPSYLDIGAHHPFNISNTALLYSRGSRGVNVEANPHLHSAFLKFRPDDKNVNVGIGKEIGYGLFYMYDSYSGRNTFSAEEVERVKNVEPPITEKIKLPIVTLNYIVDKFCAGIFPDLLTIDVEGFDYDIINSTDFSKSQPRIICVEVTRAETVRFIELMKCIDFFAFVRMGENLIFVNEKSIEYVL